MMASASHYIIPNHDAMLMRGRRILWLVPLMMLSLGLLAILATGSPTALLLGLIAGLCVSMPIAFLMIHVVSARHAHLENERRTKHSFFWYRATFPEHARANGVVSCRHCNSQRMRVTNLMQRSYTRMHACMQCGETLYFSPEKN